MTAIRFTKENKHAFDMGKKTEQMRTKKEIEKLIPHMHGDHSNTCAWCVLEILKKRLEVKE